MDRDSLRGALALIALLLLFFGVTIQFGVAPALITTAIALIFVILVTEF